MSRLHNPEQKLKKRKQKQKQETEHRIYYKIAAKKKMPYIIYGKPYI